MIPLKEIECILLDMDGTLLDKHFDDYFWEHLVPERYAALKNISFGAAREVLMKKYRAHEGTLNWTDIDFWSEQLDLDIPALKEQIRHLIQVHPHVEDFLSALKKHHKRVYMVTNAHYKVLDIKMKKTRLGKYFDQCFTSFEIGFPKEMPGFWYRLEKLIDFDKKRTLLIDDTSEILKTAEAYGIAYTVLKTKANSRKHSESPPGFIHLGDFSELLPLFH